MGCSKHEGWRDRPRERTNKVTDELDEPKTWGEWFDQWVWLIESNHGNLRNINHRESFLDWLECNTGWTTDDELPDEIAQFIVTLKLRGV